jgi:NADH-quinone oxidoreductase subunit L
MSVPLPAILLIVATLLPLVSFVLLVFTAKRLGSPAAGWVGTLFIAGSFACTMGAMMLWMGNTEGWGSGIGPIDLPIPFIPVGEWPGQVHPGFLDIGIYIDSLTILMFAMVTLVSTLIFIFSIGYMRTDVRFGRFFTYLSLFCFSMLGLVIGGTILQLFIFWELVGLCSYLLIGFWYEKKSASNAAIKAFVTNRVGDFGFLIGLGILFYHLGNVTLPQVWTMLDATKLAASPDGILLTTGVTISTALLTIMGIGLFFGAIGKSAQFPLHVWLPDAMEGPTPVSALIHAATMVAAGVYLVARMFPVFNASPDTMAVVGAIGGITAITAALTAIVMTDLKRVLAYSTISQLGYMMLALGIGAYVAAIFHLFTHAFFKALLFLGSGSVNHATNTFDMRLMGGLRKTMPITYITFIIAGLSLSGIFPLAGFWSKDEILSDAWAHERYLFIIGVVTAGLTSFYVFRAIFMTFGGEYRGGAPIDVPEAPAIDEAHGHEGGHGTVPHESPPVMAWPLIVLAVPAAIAGLANLPWAFAGLDHEMERLLVGALPAEVHVEHPVFRFGVAAVSTAVALGGIFLAWLIYSARLISAENLRAMFRPVHALLENRYYMDVLYERVIVTQGFYGFLSGSLATLDRVVVDGAVNGAGRLARGTGGVLRHVQTGQFQTYGAIGFAGALFALIVVLVLNPP